jgi:hypothetical protein
MPAGLHYNVRRPAAPESGFAGRPRMLSAISCTFFESSIARRFTGT